MYTARNIKNQHNCLFQNLGSTLKQKRQEKVYIYDSVNINIVTLRYLYCIKTLEVPLWVSPVIIGIVSCRTLCRERITFE